MMILKRTISRRADGVSVTAFSGASPIPFAIELEQSQEQIKLHGLEELQGLKYACEKILEEIDRP